MYLVYDIDVGSFLKACATFDRFRKNLVTDQDKAGAIHAFEFSYELAWKTMKRLLAHKGIEARSPRDCFRESAIQGMISDPQPWFRFIELRNMTVHTYEESCVEEIIDMFEAYAQALSSFLNYLHHEHAKSPGA